MHRLAGRRERRDAYRKCERQRERDHALCARFARKHAAHAPLHRLFVGGQRHAEGQELVCGMCLDAAV